MFIYCFFFVFIVQLQLPEDRKHVFSSITFYPAACNSVTKISTDSSKDYSKDHLVSIKLKNMQKYLQPLLKLITKCEEQVSDTTISISDEKKTYYLLSLRKLSLIKEILEGKDFLVPSECTRVEFLEKIENQLISLSHSLSRTSSVPSKEGLLYREIFFFLKTFMKHCFSISFITSKLTFLFIL